MKKKLIQLLIISALFLLFINLKAQPYLIDNEELKGLKNSKLYVVMEMDKTDINNDYYDVFKEVWTYCPYEIIEPDKILNYMEEGVYFMHLSFTFYDELREYASELIIYTPKPSFIKKLERKSTKLNNLDLSDIAIKIAIINLNLNPDKSINFNFWRSYKTDFMGKEFIITTGAGILKNYLQFLQHTLNKKIFWRDKKDFCNNNEVKKLKSHTLYIPEEFLKSYEKNEKKDFNMDEIAKEYNYSGIYEVISTTELNEIILKSNEVFFYFNLYSYFNKYNTGKTMTITNGLTGDIIYKESFMTIRRFSPNFFKNLSILLIEGN
jgi:hypothetical protein